MNIKARFVLIFTLVLLSGAVLWATLTLAAPGEAPMAGGTPTVVAYQGEVRVSGNPYSDAGYFKFAVVNAAGSASYWSNDGTSSGGVAPTASVQLAVSEGWFSVLLGDTTLSGMTQSLSADVFSQPDRYLRVWFSTSTGGPFNQLTPDTRIAAVPYALQAQEAADADTLDGFHASDLGADPQNVVVVAKSGGDYSSVQKAIDDINDAEVNNPYLVWVAPGIYSETVTMKSYVHLQGAGQNATVITSTASSSGDWPPSQATVLLASDTSLRDLTLGNGGTGEENTAMLATTGMTRTIVADVTVRALGGGENNLAIFLSGDGTSVTLQQVTAVSENGSNANFGLVNFSGAAVILRGGSFTGRGGNYTCGIFSANSGTWLEAINVLALGENANESNNGLINNNGAAMLLHGGSFIGRGGQGTWGINNADPDSTMEAEGITALGENGSGYNHGFDNYNAAVAILHGGSTTGRGGTHAHGIHNNGNTTLTTEGITALGENGSAINYGLDNADQAAATLRSSSFTGSGGTHAWGIHNIAISTTLETENVVSLGEGGFIVNAGLLNSVNTVTVLNGGTFIGSGGINAYGIFNEDSSGMLEANNITALGENGSTLSYGMENYDSSVARLRGGTYSGIGGGQASGVQNTLGSTLTAEGITALAENGSSENYGLFSNNTVTTTLLGGSYTGRGGAATYGIYCADSPTMAVVENLTALGENGSGSNHGLYNSSASAMVLRGGSFIARGGTNAYGIYNAGTMDTANTTAVGEDGSSINYGLNNKFGDMTAASSQFIGSPGLYLDGGTMYLGVSQLDGGALNTFGTLTCFQVYDGSYAALTCP
jgi:hypothetical protein